jgi:hypothetical protein
MLTLSILLYIYLAFLAIWLLFSATGVYHLLKFGLKNAVTVLAIIAYFSMSVLILGISFFYIVQVDWNNELIEKIDPGSNSQFWPSGL